MSCAAILFFAMSKPVYWSCTRAANVLICAQMHRLLSSPHLDLISRYCHYVLLHRWRHIFTICIFHLPYSTLKLLCCLINGKLVVQSSCGAHRSVSAKTEIYLSACHKAQCVQCELKLR